MVAVRLSATYVGERQCGHAWYMHGTSMTIACSLWQPASTTTELSRAAAAFRSSTRRLQPLQHILGGLRLHAEWPNVSTFLDLHADYDMLCGIGLRSWMRHRELYPTTESFHDVDGTPRRQSRTTACLGRIGGFSETYGVRAVPLGGNLRNTFVIVRPRPRHRPPIPPSSSCEAA